MRTLCLFAAAIAAVAGNAPAQKLAVVDTEVHQYEGGPRISPDVYFVPNDTVYVTFRVEGFSTKEKGNDSDDRYLRLHYQVEAFDPAGLPLKEKQEGDIAADLTPEDRKDKWLPLVQYDVTVPPAAPSGTYRVSVNVLDQLNQATVSHDIEYPVRGRRVEPSDTIVVRNLQFMRSELDTEPLAVPAYHPGETMWSRFFITGYRLAKGNKFHINYGIKILRPSGAVVYTQEVAATDERESFYPERYIMGGLSLNLTPDLPKGDYTLVVTVRDLLANQTSEFSQVFHVE